MNAVRWACVLSFLVFFAALSVSCERSGELELPLDRGLEYEPGRGNPAGPQGARAELPAPRIYGTALTAAGGQHRVSGPYTYHNLSLYLIHGKDRLEGKTFLTLDKAMEERKLIVHETGDVNRLAVENKSDEEVFIQAGDIVKGGQQDRVLAVDIVVPPRSGRVPIQSFCVESGRWARRGSEQVGVFSSSNENVACNSLKIAVKHSKAQRMVWAKVKGAQDRLNSGLVVAGSNEDARVDHNESPSSYQLSLESKALQAANDKYMRALSGLIKGRKDVLGFACAINGRINSADVYGSKKLFLTLWRRMLRSCATEAIGEIEPGPVPAAPSAARVLAFLVEAEKGPAKVKAVSGGISERTVEKEDVLFFESCEKADRKNWIHRNYLSRKFDKKKNGSKRPPRLPGTNEDWNNED